MTERVKPSKIIYQNETENCNVLLDSVVLQRSSHTPKCLLKPNGYVVLDYGKEMQGGICLLFDLITDKSGDLKDGNLHIRFGESLTECMSELGFKNSGNYHSMRDFCIAITSGEDKRIGNTGFRFVRIDNVSECDTLICSAFAENTYFNEGQKGTFECDDAVVNDIFNTAKYTLDLCIQNGYIWDGIKRDRLVWIGDMYPEVMSALCVHGNIDEIKNSILFCRDNTLEKEWCNHIPAYSVWWIFVACEYVTYCKDNSFLKENEGFILRILNDVYNCLDENGVFDVRRIDNYYYEDNETFFDWPTAKTPDSAFGVQALIIVAVKRLLAIVGERGVVGQLCTKILNLAQNQKEYNGNYKQILAMRYLAGLEKDEQLCLGKLTEGNAQGLSCFMSYFILSAIAELGDAKKAFDIMKEYYGAMLSMGATSFWEDFDVSWTKNSARLDEMPKDGQNDIHGDFGRFCYTQFRHSLCHGWSSGCIGFLYKYIVGINVKKSGCKEIVISPRLCGLKHVKCALPTPYGLVEIEHTVDDVGKITTKVNAPKEITVKMSEENYVR